MKFKEIIKLPYTNFKNNRLVMSLMIVAIVLSAFYPSDMDGYYAIDRDGRDRPVVMATENYIRYTNTLLPIVTTVALRDWVGMKQIVVTAFSLIVATHVPKNVLNNVTFMGTRLGQRPRHTDSRHNMPSGHSSEVAGTAFFVMRRYSYYFGIIVVPIVFMTMYARFMLNEHTISATISGALLGVLVTWLFTTYNSDFNEKVSKLFSRLRGR